MTNDTAQKPKKEELLIRTPLYMHKINDLYESLMNKKVNLADAKYNKEYGEAVTLFAELKKDPGYTALNEDEIKGINQKHCDLVVKKITNLNEMMADKKRPQSMRDSASKRAAEEYERVRKEEEVYPLVSRKLEQMETKKPSAETVTKKLTEAELWEALQDKAQRSGIQEAIADFLRDDKRDEFTLTVYGSGANPKDYVQMINWFNKKQKIGAPELVSTGAKTEYVQSEMVLGRAIQSTSIVIKKSVPAKDAAEKIEALKILYKKAYENPDRADLYNGFVSEYEGINKEADRYRNAISKEALEEMRLRALGRRQAALLVLQYQSFEGDPLNENLKKGFLDQYKNSTSGPNGRVDDKFYNAEFSAYVKGQLGVTHNELQRRYDQVLYIQSLIENLDKAARKNPRPEEEEVRQAFNTAVAGLKETGAENIYLSLMEQKYGTKNLIERKEGTKIIPGEYEKIMKNEKFREWREEFLNHSEYPKELLQLELRAQYALFENIEPELKKRTAYDERTLKMVAKSLNVVDQVGHVNFLQRTLPVFIHYFPNDFDAVTVLAATYQETLKSVPFVRIQNDRIRKYWLKAGKDVENYLSADVIRLINDFKKLPEEEQMKIITEIERSRAWVRGLPDLGLKDIKHPYRYNDLINSTPSFDEIARLIIVPEAVRRAYPPGLVFGYLPIFAVTDILSRTAAELSQLKVEKWELTNFSANYGQEWPEKGTEAGLGIGGTYNRIDARIKTIKGKLDIATGDAYYIPLGQMAQINGARLDFQHEDHVNAYLNAGVPGHVNLVTMTNQNKRDDTWESRSYMRMLTPDGTSRWVHYFTTKLTPEEARMDYARYGDLTRDVRVRTDDKKLTGFTTGTTITNNTAMAAVLDGRSTEEESKAAGVAIRPWKEKGGRIEETRIYAKYYDVVDAEEGKSKQLASSLIGTNIELTAARETEGRDREAYVAKWLKGKGYYETVYYNYIKEKGGDIYLKYGPIGKVLNSWVLARAIAIDQRVDTSAITGVEIEGLGITQFTTKPELKTVKFMGERMRGFEAASGENEKLFNAMLSLRGYGGGAEYEKEEYKKIYGTGPTFPLGAHIAAIRGSIFRGPLDLSGVGWFVGFNFFQHEPLAAILLTTGEKFNDTITKEENLSENLGLFIRRWYDQEMFIIVDEKRNTSFVTGKDTLNKLGIKAGVRYYKVKPSGTWTWTFTGEHENDRVNKENITSIGTNVKKMAENTWSVDVQYRDRKGTEHTGEFKLQLLYQQPLSR